MFGYMLLLCFKEMSQIKYKKTWREAKVVFHAHVFKKLYVINILSGY